MNLTQRIYNMIKNFHTPRWIVAILQEVQNILISTMISVGKEYIKQMESKICEVSDKNISNKEKFQIVFNFGKTLMPAIKDSVLNLLIETLVNRLKKSGFARET